MRRSIRSGSTATASGFDRKIAGVRVQIFAALYPFLEVFYAGTYLDRGSVPETGGGY